MSDLVPVRRALISVYDKSGLADFAKALHHEFKVELLSTGGTAKFLRDLETQTQGRARRAAWPAWKGERLSPFLPLLFLLFTATLGAEWWLRRRWGLA